MIVDPLFWGALFVGPVAYWLLPERYRMPFLFGLSGLWLGLRAPFSGALVVGWTAFVFWAARRVRASSRPLAALAGLIGVVLTYLLLFKHVPKLLDGRVELPVEALLLIPLGINYYVFKLIHYAIELRRNRLPEHTIFDALAWTTLFPAFVAGPIEPFDHFLSKRRDTFEAKLLVEGLSRIVLAFVKLTVFVLVIEPRKWGDGLLGALDTLSWSELWAEMGLVLLSSFLHFSALSDIAVGGALLFGIRLVENFDFPLTAPNIAQFWRRWHMSLASWCRGYVYMPFFSLTRHPYRAVYLTFLAIGLWHGLALNWVAWGVLHGTAVAVHLRWTRYRKKNRAARWLDTPIARWASVVPTIAFVASTGAFTSTESQGGLAGLTVFLALFGVRI